MPQSGARQDVTVGILGVCRSILGTKWIEQGAEEEVSPAGGFCGTPGHVPEDQRKAQGRHRAGQDTRGSRTVRRPRHSRRRCVLSSEPF